MYLLPKRLVRGKLPGQCSCAERRIDTKEEERVDPMPPVVTKVIVDSVIYGLDASGRGLL